MKTYSVKIPIAGHAYIEIEADSEEEAIDKAFASEITNEDIESWDTVRQFNQGNVCYCPQPWEATAEAIGDEY